VIRGLAQHTSVEVFVLLRFTRFDVAIVLCVWRICGRLYFSVDLVRISSTGMSLFTVGGAASPHSHHFIALTWTCGACA
jgi:hypothetical protein